MARLFVPTLWADLAGGQDSIEIPGRTLGQILNRLADEYPELAAQLRAGESLSANLSLVVDGALAPRSLTTEIDPGSEIHFLPLIAGG